MFLREVVQPLVAYANRKPSGRSMMFSAMTSRFLRSMLSVLVSCCLVPAIFGEARARKPVGVPSATECRSSFDPSEEQLLGGVLDELVAKNSDFSADTVMDVRLRRIIQRLSATLDTPHVHFVAYVIHSAELNATGSPSGHLYLSSAMTEAVENDDELAFVVAHEMSHVLLHHPALVATVDLRAALGAERPATREELKRIYGVMFGPGGLAPSSTRYHCVSEVATDAAALTLMEAAGYSRSASVNLWSRLLVRKQVQEEKNAEGRLGSLERLTASTSANKANVRRYGAIHSAARFLSLTLRLP